MTVQRYAITPVMKINAFLWRFTINCRLCGNLLNPSDKIEWDHVQALIHSGPHDHTNIAPVHKECHFAKTALDVKANAKVKRIIKKAAGQTKAKKPIPSRPFSKQQRKLGR